MTSSDFSHIAARYERDSLIQKSAAEKLISLLAIQRSDDVLDLGCGTGSLTRKLRSLTEGTVIGIDPSAGMIREAEANRDRLDIIFEKHGVDTMPYEERFDLIICNSAFQWFREAEGALENCLKALRTGGRMGIQAPAGKTYCPNFLAAIDAVSVDPRTAATFAGFESPWLFLDTADEYAALFRRAGFKVPFARMAELRSSHNPSEVMSIFESGAAAGYLNPEYYDADIDASFTAAFREIARASFQQQANRDGKVELVFSRIYLMGVKS